MTSKTKRLFVILFAVAVVFLSQIACASDACTVAGCTEEGQQTAEQASNTGQDVQDAYDSFNAFFGGK
jgi:hypothetical protein